MGKTTRAAQDKLDLQEACVCAHLRTRTAELELKAAAPPQPAIDELSAYRKLFLRDPEILRSRTKSRDRDRRVLELVRHAFGKYPTSRALSRAWTQPPIGATLKVDFRLWHICVATGGSLYKGHAKEHLTKMETHFFLTCPHDISIAQALCHSVARAAGASAGLALRLSCSKISAKPFDDFWRQVLRFFSRHAPPSIESTDDLCDYLQHRQYDGGQNILAGMTFESLKQREIDWQRALQRARVLGDAHWTGRAQPDDVFERRDPKTGDLVFWDFTQIKNAKELAAEGTRMRHCVFSYKRDIIAGSLSIWSLSRREHFGLVTKKLTIELGCDGSISQARGLANRSARPDELVLLKAWAQHRGLRSTLF